MNINIAGLIGLLNGVIVNAGEKAVDDALAALVVKGDITQAECDQLTPAINTIISVGAPIIERKLAP